MSYKSYVNAEEMRVEFIDTRNELPGLSYLLYVKDKCIKRTGKWGVEYWKPS